MNILNRQQAYISAHCTVTEHGRLYSVHCRRLLEKNVRTSSSDSVTEGITILNTYQRLCNATTFS